MLRKENIPWEIVYQELVIKSIFLITSQLIHFCTYQSLFFHTSSLYRRYLLHLLQQLLVQYTLHHAGRLESSRENALY